MPKPLPPLENCGQRGMRAIAELSSRGVHKPQPHFTLERKRVLQDWPSKGLRSIVAQAQLHPGVTVDWVHLFRRTGAKPIILTLYPDAKHVKEIEAGVKRLVFGGVGSPGIDFPGSVGTVSAKLVERKGKPPFVEVDLVQGGMRHKVTVPELAWVDNSPIWESRRVTAVPRKIVKSYYNWRVHLFNHLFQHALEGGEWSGVRRVALRRRFYQDDDGMRVELGKETHEFFKEAAERHGFRVRYFKDLVVARR